MRPRSVELYVEHGETVKKMEERVHVCQCDFCGNEIKKTLLPLVLNIMQRMKMANPAGISGKSRRTNKKGGKPPTPLFKSQVFTPYTSKCWDDESRITNKISGPV